MFASMVRCGAWAESPTPQSPHITVFFFIAVFFFDVFIFIIFIFRLGAGIAAIARLVIIVAGLIFYGSHPELSTTLGHWIGFGGLDGRRLQKTVAGYCTVTESQ